MEKLKEWVNKVLMDLESLPEALQKEDLTVESDLARLSIDRLEFIYKRIEDKINSEITIEQDAEHRWEADNGR